MTPVQTLENVLAETEAINDPLGPPLEQLERLESLLIDRLAETPTLIHTDERQSSQKSLERLTRFQAWIDHQKRTHFSSCHIQVLESIESKIIRICEHISDELRFESNLDRVLVEDIELLKNLAK